MPPSYLLGYSLGARLVLQALPKLLEGSLRGAVLLSCHPGLTSEEERQRRLASDFIWLQKWEKLRLAPFLDEWENQSVLRAEPAPADRSRRKLLEETLGHCPEAGRRALDLWSLARQPDMRSFLTNCRLPLLWITGERDEKFTLLGREVAQLNALIRHETLRDCGHRVLWEAPEKCAELTADFVKSCAD